MLINTVFAKFINMVFNVGMDTTKTDHPDWALITRLGGPAKVAKLLSYELQGGTQRVQNWRYRGIPASVKLGRPDIFLTELVASRLRRGPDAATDGEGDETGGKAAVLHSVGN